MKIRWQFCNFQIDTTTGATQPTVEEINVLGFADTQLAEDR